MFLSVFFGTAFFVSAQTPPDSLNPESFLSQLLGGSTSTSTEDALKNLLKQQDDIRNSGASIAFDPEFPGPTETVEVRLTSYSFDVNSSYITWVRNGKTVLSGRGEGAYRFVTGDVGAREIITLSAVSLDGKEFTTSKIFYVGSLDLVWTAKTAIPPEFKGKALASPRSQVMVTAFPRFVIGGKTISPSSLYYDWILDDAPQTSKSGYGKRTLSFYTSVATGAEHQITLKAYNSDKSVVSQKSITLTTRDPEVLIYEEDPSGGPVMSRALRDFKMFAGEEKRFRVLPYFFSKNNGSDLEYSWTVDGKSAEPDKPADILWLKLTDDAAGQTNIGITVSNLKNIVQRALSAFVINIL